MKRILVIGGMGYIGAHVAVELYAAGFEPIILDNLNNSDTSKLDGIERISGKRPLFYQEDYGNTVALEHLLQTEHIDGVIHFAAHKAVGESVQDPLMYYQNNVSNYVTLLSILQAHSIQNFVFSSSAAVYGSPEGAKVDETEPCRPANPYGRTKYMNEMILNDCCTSNPELRGVALRYFNVVGAHESGLIGELPKGTPNNLLPILVRVASGEAPPFTVYGTDYDTPDGTCLRDYIHVVDLAAAHIAALQNLFAQEHGGYHVYNIGTGRPTSVMELINAFESINDIKLEYSIGPRRAGDPTAYYAIADKANEELGWQSHKTIEDAVRDSWFSQQVLLGRAEPSIPETHQ